ncbi:SAM-dependent methyltransferase [Streptosporangiaceae bacterium NEAU-GS5]|nr:SAM-dependent methyltransferase [Streptosporangiaceae bacterium NEAU-GS5]
MSIRRFQPGRLADVAYTSQARLGYDPQLARAEVSRVTKYAVTNKAIPPGIDTTTPNSARIYDYLLGGKDNFAPDRAAAEQLVDLSRRTGFDVRESVRANRAYLVRMVRTLAAAGVHQFLDLGAGLPTQQNVHQVAQAEAPSARVVYVDNDPVVLNHARALLADSKRTIAVEGDLREPGKILADPAIRAHLDFEQPVAILVLSILHFFSDDEQVAEIMATLREALPPGGHLAISHSYVQHSGPNEMDGVRSVFRKTTAGDIKNRTAEELAVYFDGLELLEPGVVSVETWRPWIDQWPGDPDHSSYLAAVGRKPLE